MVTFHWLRQVVAVRRKFIALSGPDFQKRNTKMAFEIELRRKSLIYEKEKTVPVTYEDQHIGDDYADFVVRRKL